MDTEAKRGYIEVLAPGDSVREIPADEINALKDSVNAQRKTQGEAELTQDECPEAKATSINAF